MEVRKRRKFEIGFKKQLVAEIESGRISLSAAARLHETSPTLIGYWRRKFRDGQLIEGPTSKERELERENARLKMKVADLTMELDNQKKYDTWIREQRRRNTSVITALNLKPSVKDVAK